MSILKRPLPLWVESVFLCTVLMCLPLAPMLETQLEHAAKAPVSVPCVIPAHPPARSR